MKAKTLVGAVIVSGVLFASAAAFAADDGDRVAWNVDRGGSAELGTKTGSSSHGADSEFSSSEHGVTTAQTVRADKVAARVDVTVDTAETQIIVERCAAAYQVESCDAAVFEILPGDPGPAGPTWLGDALDLR